MSDSFFNSKHCSSRKHCQACRSVKSNNFRSSVNSFYNIGQDDFECPYGVNWGFQKAVSTPVVSKPVTDVIAEDSAPSDKEKRSLEAKRKAIEKIEAEKLRNQKNSNHINDKLRTGELYLLNHKYIMNHLGVFRKIKDFDKQFKECDKLLKEAVKDAHHALGEKLIRN
jgi:hypothetical protein